MDKRILAHDLCLRCIIKWSQVYNSKFMIVLFI